MTSTAHRHGDMGGMTVTMGVRRHVRRAVLPGLGFVLTVLLVTDPGPAGTVWQQLALAAEAQQVDTLESRGANRAEAVLDEPTQVAVSDRQVEVEQPPVYETPVP